MKVLGTRYTGARITAPVLLVAGGDGGRRCSPGNAVCQAPCKGPHVNKLGLVPFDNLRKLRLRQNEITCPRWEVVGSIKSSWKD